MVGQDPRVLADEFGLPRRFVRDVQRFLTVSTRPENYLREALMDFWSKFVVGWAWARSMVDRLVPRVSRNLVLVTLVAMLAQVIASTAGRSPITVVQGRLESLELRDWHAAIMVLMLAVHAVLLFRVARMELARSSTVLTSLLVVVPLGPVLVWGYGMALLPAAVTVCLGVVLFATVYGLFAFTLSIAGATARMVVVQAAEDNRTRQELLDRLLVVRERLHNLEHLEVAATPPTLGVPRFLERRVFTVSAFTVGALGTLYRVILSNVSHSATLSDVVRVIANPIFFFIIFYFAYAAGTVRRAVLVGLASAAVLQLTTAIPAAPFGEREFISRLTGGDFLVNCVGALMLGAIAGLASRTEEHAAKSRRVRQSDSAALVAEWVRLHWRLAPEKSVVTIMVIDVRGSTAMKSDADPLVAEWSFREYHKFIAQIADRFGGTVHATTGDGAVLWFASPNEAFAAARTIQGRLVEFNQTVNRLNQPFRVRIGLHRGSVAGDLDEVEFTEVIDIAAHIEAESPVGGIAMSKGVADMLEGEKLAQIVTDIEGVDVFIALEPEGL